MRIAYVAAPDVLLPALVLTGLWCLTACTLLGVALLRRVGDAPASSSAWLLVLAVTAAVPVTSLLAADSFLDGVP